MNLATKKISLHLFLTGLLWADGLAMATALMAALFSTSRKTGIALAADRALNVGLFGKEAE